MFDQSVKLEILCLETQQKLFLLSLSYEAPSTFYFPIDLQFQFLSRVIEIHRKNFVDLFRRDGVRCRPFQKQFNRSLGF